MSKVLTLCCDTADCRAMVHGEDEVDLIDRVYPIGTRYEDVGDSVLSNAHGIEQDLFAKADAAGWNWDGIRWHCNDCFQRGENLKPIEAVAHSMNV